jgi:hypothetical protein
MGGEVMSELTPAQIERRLYELSKEIDLAHAGHVEMEQVYHSTKATLEIGMAKSRMKNSHPDMKMTVGQREDQALIENETLYTALAIAEATVKAERANSNRLRTQVDIARSVSVSIRASLEM